MQTWYRVVAAAIGWFVIGLQYYLIASKPDVTLAEAAIRLLSFFTILTNILVALAMTLPWLAPESKLAAFFSRPSVRTAIACLHHCRLGGLLRDPAQALESGRPAISRRYDRALCRTRPLYRRLARVRAEGDGLGKVGPMVAALSRGLRRFSLIHGAVTGFYPYPFLEVTQLGYERVLLNMGVLTAAFAVLGLILVGIDRLLGAVELRKAS